MWLWKWVLLYMLLVASSVAKKQKLEIITEVRRVGYVRGFQYTQTVFRILLSINLSGQVGVKNLFLISVLEF